MKSDDLEGSQEPESLGSGRRHYDNDSEFDEPKVMKGLVNALNDERQEGILGVGSFLFEDEADAPPVFIKEIPQLKAPLSCYPTLLIVELF